MSTWQLLQLASVQNALLAALVIGVAAGVVGPFVVARRMAFAVHGIAELAFTGAAAGLLAADQPVLGALVGSLVVATLLAALGQREAQRDSSIGVVLAFGLGLGLLLLHYYRGFATAATNILFGQVNGVSERQLGLLVGLAILVVTGVAVLWRPLVFASIDPEVAEARGVPTRLVSLLFLFLLAFTVTEAAQIVGTLLVLSLVITPAAAAQRLTAGPGAAIAVAACLAVAAGDGGIALSVAGDVPPSVFVTTISFTLYLLARVLGGARRSRQGRRLAAVVGAAADDSHGGPTP